MMFVHIINTQIAFALNGNRIFFIDYQQVNFQAFTIAFNGYILLDFVDINATLLK